MDGENNGNPIQMDDLGVPLFLETPIYTSPKESTAQLLSFVVPLPSACEVEIGRSFAAAAKR